MPRLAASLLVLIALAPAAQASVALPVPWQQGMSLRYRSQATTDKTRGKLHTRIQTQDVVEVSVPEADAQGFLQQWRSLSPEVAVTGDAAQSPAESRMARALVARFRTLPLQAQLDPRGAYRGLRNWEALAAAMREVMLPAMLDQSAARKDLPAASQEERAAKFQPELARLTTREAIDAGLGRQVALFNYFTAANIGRGKPVSYEEELPSPWSAGSIAGRGSFELVAEDAAAGTITIRWRQGIDPLKGRETAWRIVDALGVRRPGGTGNDGLPKGLVLSDEATVVLARATGLLLRLEHRREVALASTGSVTSWTFEKLPERTAR